MARQPAGTRADYRAFKQIPTRWDDNDAYGHLNNAIYFALFDTALSQWQISNGIPIHGPGAHRFVVVQSRCTYHAEAAFPDMIHAGLRLASLGNSSFRIDIGLFRNTDDTACAEGFFVQVHTGDAACPAPVPVAVREILERLR